jgi:hypothetical protein
MHGSWCDLRSGKTGREWLNEQELTRLSFGYWERVWHRTEGRQRKLRSGRVPNWESGLHSLTVLIICSKPPTLTLRAFEGPGLDWVEGY